MGRHSAPRRRGPLMVVGAAAGLLTASGLVVGFSPDLSTHALQALPSLQERVGPTSVQVRTPVAPLTPAPTSSPTTSNRPTPQATPDRSAEDTASRTTTRSPRPATSSQEPETTPTPSPTKADKRQGTPAPASTRKPGQSTQPSRTTDMTGLLASIPVLP